MKNKSLIQQYEEVEEKLAEFIRKRAADPLEEKQMQAVLESLFDITSQMI